MSGGEDGTCAATAEGADVDVEAAPVPDPVPPAAVAVDALVAEERLVFEDADRPYLMASTAAVERR